MKKWYASKTLWVNAIGIFWLLFAAKLGLPTLDPTMEAAILMVVNMILRAVTKEPIEWSAKTEG